MNEKTEWRVIGGSFEEPIMACPRCGADAVANWTDNGFGPYSVQVGAFHCGRCGWTEGDAPMEKEPDRDAAMILPKADLDEECLFA